MRLAALMHRTVEELHETMSAEEWSRWLLFHSLFDLPDSFMVVGQICMVVNRAIGGKAHQEDFAPIYKPDPKEPSRPTSQSNSNMREAFSFVAAYAKERAASGRPLPRSRR